MAFFDVVKSMCTERHVPLSKMERDIGISRGASYKWKKSSPSKEVIEKIAAYFDVSADYLLTGEEPSSAPRIPVVSTIRAGMPVATYEDILGYEEITEKMAEAGEHICLKVKGDSMNPVIQNGDLVIVRLQSDVESGDIAVVRINGDEATLKEVKKSETGITLIGYNTAVYTPHFYSNEEIEKLPVEIDGKVVEMKRSF